MGLCHSCPPQVFKSCPGYFGRLFPLPDADVKCANVRSPISIIIQLLPPTFRGRLRLRGGRDAHCVWREILATGPSPLPQLSALSTIPMCLAQRRGSDFCRERLSRFTCAVSSGKTRPLGTGVQLEHLHSGSIIASLYLGKPDKRHDERRLHAESRGMLNRMYQTPNNNASQCNCCSPCQPLTSEGRVLLVRLRLLIMERDIKQGCRLRPSVCRLPVCPPPSFPPLQLPSMPHK